MKTFVLSDTCSRLTALTLFAALGCMPALRAQQTTAPVPEASATAPMPPPEETVVMSPFEVNVEQDHGYLASSTMSGTRLNTKLEDLATAITVVTKQQLLDTASIDINDVFLFEGNTEGIHQYTEYTLDRDVMIDTVAQNPGGANRVRGLGAANVAIGNFASSGRVPIDTYNVDSVEISRGPNSSLFGIGNTAGTININASSANLTREINSFSARVDSYGGYRGSFTVNRPIIANALALRLDALYEDKGFERKPSLDKTNRATLSLTAKPWRRTTIKASYETYHNSNRRPNATTPRDVVTEWAGQGRPVWNPVTQTLRYLDRPEVTPFVVTTGNEATLLPYSVLLSDSGFQGRPSWYIDNGEVELYMINRMPASGQATPNNISGAQRLMQTGTYYVRNASNFPLYVSPGISDQSLYDWESININAPNWGKTKSDNYRVELEQYFITSDVQTLAFQGGFFREDSDTINRYFMANSDGAKSQVLVDINEYLLDGSPNPYFLRPYIGGSQPTYYRKPDKNDNYRGTVAYLLDMTRHESWLRWIGRHNVTAYGEFRKVLGTNSGNGLLYRDRIVSNNSFVNPANLSTGGGTAIYPRYYVGDATGSGVDYAPTPLVGDGAGDYTLRWYNGATNTWIDDPVVIESLLYGNRMKRTEIRTLGFVWQGYFLNDRIIPTFGARKDRHRDKESDSIVLNPATGRYNEAPLNQWNRVWNEREGITRTKGIVVKPLSWLFFHYNQSDSFTPATTAYNIYGGTLPNPTGEGEDYGFTLNLFEGKFTVRFNHYQTDEKNKRGTMGTIMNRIARLDFDDNSNLTGGDPDLYSFLAAAYLQQDPSLTTEQIDARASTDMGMDMSYFRWIESLGGNMNDTNTAISKGNEVEIYYNPSRNWTFKANVTQQQAIDSDLSPLSQQWIDDRMSVWTSVTSPVDGSSWWNGTYRVGGRTPKEWYELNVLKEIRLATALQGKPKPQTREWRVNMMTTYRFAGVTEHKWLKNLDVGGSLRWEDKGSIGFYGAAPETDGVVRTLDASRPIWDKARTYVDLNAGYNFRMLGDRVRTRLQLNVRNAFESGRLQVIRANPDGTASAFRIIDPRQFILTATFDL